jgi:hypothetical protein
MTIRRSERDLPTFEEVCALTGDRFTYVKVNVRSMDGQRDMEMVDVTIEGGKEDENRFWLAFSCYGLVEGSCDENGVYSFKRMYTDEKIEKEFSRYIRTA